MEKKRCLLHRIPESLSIVKGIGYCDISGGWSICEGDICFCDKIDGLKAFVKRRLVAFSPTSQQPVHPSL